MAEEKKVFSMKNYFLGGSFWTFFLLNDWILFICNPTWPSTITEDHNGDLERVFPFSYRKGKKFLNYKRRESRNSYQFFSYHFLHVKFGSKCFKERKTNVKKFFFWCFIVLLVTKNQIWLKWVKNLYIFKLFTFSLIKSWNKLNEFKIIYIYIYN